MGGGGSGSDNPYCESLSDAPYEEGWDKPYGLHSIHDLESTFPSHAMNVGERGRWDKIDTEGMEAIYTIYYYCRVRLL